MHRKMESMRYSLEIISLFESDNLLDQISLSAHSFHAKAHSYYIVTVSFTQSLGTPQLDWNGGME